MVKELRKKWRQWAKRADVDQWTGPRRKDSGEPVKDEGETGNKKKDAGPKEQKNEAA